MSGDDPNPVVPRAHPAPEPTVDHVPAEDTSSRAADESDADPNRTMDHSGAGGPGEEERPGAGAAGIPGYEILSKIGEGGMGVVYRARHLSLNCIHAIKLIRAEEATRSDLIRFSAEAEAVAAIKHPNVVQVHGYGEANGQPYMALEYLPGGKLAKRFQAARESATVSGASRDVVDLLSQIAHGVAAAHALGIVHRDLKPANVLLDESNIPKVADFGLAKRAGHDAVTRTHQVVGTVAYMSPEQAKGESRFVGPQADVWALGVMLYEAMTGVRPFTGTVQETLAKVQNAEPVSPRKLVPAGSRDLELICLKCLAKAPHERYPTAKELAEDLDRLLRGETISVRPAGPIERSLKWVRRNRVVSGSAAAVFLALTVGLGVSLWQMDRANREKQRADIKAAVAEDEAVRAATAEDAERKRAGELAATARNLAISAEDLSRQVIQTRQERDTGAFLLAAEDLERHDTNSAFDRLQSIEPHNRNWEWYFLSRQCRDTALMRLEGHGDYVQGVQWSPGGHALWTAGDDGVLIRWDSRTGQLRSRIATGRSGVRVFARNAAGDRLALGGPSSPVVTIWDINAGNSVDSIRVPGRGVNSADFSPDGSKLIIGSSSGIAVIWDLEARSVWKVLSPPRNDRNVTYPMHLARFSPDGSRIATIHGPAIHLWDARTGVMITRLQEISAATLDFSPDGTRLAIPDSRRGFVIWNLDDRKPYLTGAGPVPNSPVHCIRFSPDGGTLATGGYDGLCHLWSTTTGEKLTDLQGHAGPVAAVAFRPDGQQLATASHDGSVRVWDLRLRWPGVEFTAPDGLRKCQLIAGDSEALLLRRGDDTGSFLRVRLSDGRLISSIHQNSLSVPSPTADRAVILRPDGLGGWVPELWDVPGGRKLCELPWQKNALPVTHWSRDGRLLVSQLRGRISVFSSATGAQLQTWDLREQAHVAAIAHDNRALITICDSKTWEWRNLATGIVERSFTTRSMQSSAYQFTPDDRLLAITDREFVRLWDTATGTEVATLHSPRGSITTMQFSRDGSRLFTSGWNPVIWVWDTRTGMRLLTIPGFPHPISDMQLTRDGRLCVVSGTSFRVLDVAHPETLCQLTGHGERVTAAIYSRDGSRILTGGRDRTIRHWDGRTGALLQTLGPLAADVIAIAFNEDESQAVIVTGDGELSIWDLAGARQVRSWGAIIDTAGVVTIGRDGRFVKSTVIDNPMRFWSVATGRELPRPPPSFEEPSRFSPDGQHVLVLEGRVVAVRPATPNAETLARRTASADTSSGFAMMKYHEARIARDGFAARFHLECGAAHDASNRGQHLLTRLADNPKRVDIRARTGLHSPHLIPQLSRKTLTAELQALVQQEPSVTNLRVLGALLREEGKPDEALRVLNEARRTRTRREEPPVEDVILAMTYLDLKKPGEARKLLAGADAWLSRGHAQPAAAVLVSSGAGRAFLPAIAASTDLRLDPRYQWTDWESWLEFDLFRRQAWGKLPR